VNLPPVQGISIVFELLIHRQQRHKINTGRRVDGSAKCVRLFGTHDNPLFVAADVCACLDIKNPRQAIARLEPEERGVISNDTLGGAQKLAVVTESGLYALVMTSRKPEAKAFKRWVTSEVLPAIRKTGRYDLEEQMRNLAFDRFLTIVPPGIQDEVPGQPIPLISRRAWILAILFCASPCPRCRHPLLS
jgi:hypothetical protein